MIDVYAVEAEYLKFIGPYKERWCRARIAANEAEWITENVSLRLFRKKEAGDTTRAYDGCAIRGEWHTAQPSFTGDPLIQLGSQQVERPRLYAVMVLS